MNEKFRTIGLDTEDKITEFIDYIDDLEDTEEIKSDVLEWKEQEKMCMRFQKDIRQSLNLVLC